MARKKANKKSDNRRFTKTANRSRKININPPAPRGGIRL